MTTNDGTNSAEQAIQDIYNALQGIERRQAQSEAQVNRLLHTTNIDEREFNVGLQQSNRAILRSVSALTQTVRALVQKQVTEMDQQTLSEGLSIYAQAKHARVQQVKKNVDEIRFLSKLVQERTEICPCGLHYGIRFLDAEGSVVVENMCPKVWWIKQSRLAFEDGHLREFTESMPMATYLKAYMKKSKKAQ